MTRFTAFRLFQGAEQPAGRPVDMTVDELSPGEVTIRVAYSSINYKDALAAAGINRIVRSFGASHASAASISRAQWPPRATRGSAKATR